LPFLHLLSPAIVSQALSLCASLPGLVVPFEEEDESPFVGLLQVEAA
jgi:hypothetical protein